MNKLARSCLVGASLWTTFAWAEEPVVYAVDGAGSDIHWRVYKAGTFARFGHNHVVSVGELSGQVTRDAGSGAGTFELAIPVAGLVVDDDMLQRLAVIILFQRFLLGHAASVSRAAWARASSVIAAPDSMRAISSQRSSGDSLRTVVRVPSAPWLFSIR